MRKAILALLTLCLFFGLALPAYAADEIDQDQREETQVQEPQEPTQEKQQHEDQQEPQDSPFVVSTFEELQTAVDTSEDGDSIYLDCTINMEDGDTLVTDKHITLRRSTGLMKTGGRMIELYGSGTISGFTFYEDCPISCSVIQTKAEGNGEIVIENCVFDVHKETNVSPYIMIDTDDTAKISGCTFYCGNGYAIYTQARTNVLIDSCTFLKRHYYRWMLISTYGNTMIENCTFGTGTGYITTALDGNLKLLNNDMTPNFYKDRIYPNILLEGKIISLGKFSILDQPSEGWGFYDLYTGEKVEIPLIDMEDQSVLSYMSDIQAEEYFSDESHIGRFDVKAEEKRDLEEEEFNPEPPIPTDENNPADTPQEPGDQTGDNNTTDEEQPPQEPTQPPETNPDNSDDGEQGQPQEPAQPPQDDPAEPPTEPVQPPEGEGKDDPAVTPPEATEQPLEPPQDVSKDDPIDTPITTPETPQQPTDSGDSEDGDHTPPVSHRPAHKPSTPVKPTLTTEPEDKPKLSCGGAMIDTSRTIVLLGYGDGDPHEEDPLTRAQLAEIIYRLLYEKSIAEFDISEQVFIDVSPDSWCYQPIQIIQKARIVYGTGGGCYSPNGLVTWAQVVTVLSRFTEPQEYTLQHIQYDGWAVKAIKTAVSLGWIQDRADFNPDAVISRGELVQLVNNVLELNR